MKMRKLLICATTILSMVINSQMLWSQENETQEDSAFTLEEVMVTAERREANAQRSSISMSVISSERLSRSGISNPKDMLDSIPGLDLTQTSSAQILSLRGQAAGSNQQWADPVISFNISGVPLARRAAYNSSMYDISRIEVLKGPQGTLYGRNATVGAINIIPNSPKDTFEGKASVTIGNYSTLNTRGMINVPFNKKIKSRFAFSTNYHEGYLTNGYNDQNDQSARGSLMYEPNDRLSVLLRADYTQSDTNGTNSLYRYIYPGQEWQNPDNPWFSFGPAGSCSDPAFCPSWGDSATQFHPGGDLVPVDAFPNDPILESRSVVGDDGFWKVKQQIYSGEINYRLNNMTLTVIPAYVLTDSSAHTYTVGLDMTTRSSAEQTSLEARLASDYKGDFKWIVGAFFFDENVNAQQENLEVGGYQILRSPNLNTESYAVFGETTIPLTDAVRLTAGLRYTHDEKSQNGWSLLDAFTSFDFNEGNCNASTGSTLVKDASIIYNNYYPFGYCIIPNTGDMSDDDLSWKIGLESDLSENSMVYANARTAYKSGGLAPGLPPNNSYKPEKLMAYEFGSKNRFFQNRLQANLEIFYWDYHDQHISILRRMEPAGQASWPLNVDGYLYGSEFAFEVLITQKDLLRFDILYATGKYDLYPLVISSAGVMGGLEDYDRVNLPKWNGTVDYQHTFDLAAVGSVLFNASCHFESKTNMRVTEDHVPGDFRDPFAKFDANITYVAPAQKWEVNAYIKNITNEPIVGAGVSNTVSTGIFYRAPTNPTDFRTAAIEAPRTFGLSVSMNF